MPNGVCGVKVCVLAADTRRYARPNEWETTFVARALKIAFEHCAAFRAHSRHVDVWNYQGLIARCVCILTIRQNAHHVYHIVSVCVCVMVSR